MMRSLAFWGVTTALTVGSALVGATLAGDRDLEALLAQDPVFRTKDLPQFLVFAGGPVPAYNEIALEKNVLYFQRTLQALGINPAMADIFFANGNDGQATVRYLDLLRREQFKPPAIDNLQGAATVENLETWFATAQTVGDRDCSTFFYFTGHGGYNPQNEDNNTLYLWRDQTWSVQDLAAQLDQLPADQPFVTMMAQCFAGSFANLIYEDGNPDNPVALQTRCGFFATVSDRPSVGCTAEVNEADYKDYSSSFFAGLSGIDRTGEAVASADYNQDGRIAYAEAHAFAKVDEETPDWPISTSESWLQRQATESDIADILQQPLTDWQNQGRPEQQFVIRSLIAKMRLDPALSFRANLRQLPSIEDLDEVEQAYLMRLRMELLNIGMAEKVRQSGDPGAIAVLDKLLACEGGSW
ncbi:Caspase domain-containing protein [Sphaerothrix gracilis]|uniref:Caspase domain-containing protein n=1 Tax=Sphaerothrix gracilis TaxID=3151835 RepID=UPI0031FBF5E3